VVRQSGNQQVKPPELQLSMASTRIVRYPDGKKMDEKVI
jgi:hypothetical protein